MGNLVRQLLKVKNCNAVVNGQMYMQSSTENAFNFQQRWALDMLVFLTHLEIFENKEVLRMKIAENDVRIQISIILFFSSF